MSEKLTEEKIADLRAQHKRVCVITCGKIEVVIRAPTRSEYRRARAATHSGGAAAADAQEDMVRSIVVYPSREEFDALLEDFPGFCENTDVSMRIKEFLGVVAADSGKP